MDPGTLCLAARARRPRHPRLRLFRGYALRVQARLLEHNVRFGDPECQGLMVRLESDLLEVRNRLSTCTHQTEAVLMMEKPAM
jgi:phosphoribosylamine-glycine ligase